MTYKFVCPKCSKEKDVQMPMTEYTAKGHICECGTELVRNPKTFCCAYQVNCDGFYGKSN